MNQTNETLEKIKEKIAKLLRKSESAKELNSMAEAMAFADKAQNLLMQYNIQLAEINLAAGLPIEPDVIIKDLTLDIFVNIESKDGVNWLINLLNVVYKNNLCNMVQMVSKGDIPTIKIFGTEANIELATDIGIKLTGAALTICKKEWADYKGEINRGKFRRDFLNYFPRGLHAQYMMIEKQKQSQGANNQISSEQVYALVRTNEVAIKNKIDELFGVGGTTRTKERRRDINAAALKGFEAGKNINLNKNISNG